MDRPLLMQKPGMLKLLRLALLASSCALIATVSHGQSYAAPTPQEVSEQDSASESAPNSQADSKADSQAVEEDETAAEKAKRDPEEARRKARALKRKRWFLGAGVARKRQVGPDVGKPLRIVPQPFVPVGSLILADPVPRPKEQSTDLAEDLQADNVQSDASSLDADGGETLPLLTDTPSGTERSDGGLEPALGADQERPNLVRDSFVETGLDKIDPSILALSIPGAPAPDTSFVWSGFARESIIEQLTNLSSGQAGGQAGARSSEVFARTLTQLARGGFDVSAAGDDDQAAAQLIDARLNVLAATGDRIGFEAMLDALTIDREWGSLAKLRVERLLLEGALADACFQAEDQRSNRSDPYWVRMGVICRGIEGDRQAVDFQFSLLEEFGPVSRAFYRLMDMILLEAEAEKAGNPRPTPPAFTDPLPLDAVHVALAKLAGVEVPYVEGSSLEPLAIYSAIRLPGMTASAKATIFGAAIRAGLAPEDAAVSFFRGYRATGSVAEAAASSDFAQEARLGATAAARGDTKARLEAARTLWSRARTGGWGARFAPVLYELIADIPLRSDLGADLAFIARLALLAGDHDAARDAFISLRSRPGGQDLSADAALEGLLPVMALAGDIPTGDLPERLFERLYQGAYAGTPEAGFNIAATYLSVLDALGAPSLDPLWDNLASKPFVQPGPTLNPGPWRRFLKSARDGSIPTLIAGVNDLVFRQNMQQPTPAVTGSVLAALVGHDLEHMARGLAIERLILAGL